MANLFNKLLNILLLVAFVLAKKEKKNDCNEIKVYLEEKLELDSADIINECTVNSYGSVTNLNIYDYYNNLKEENIIKLINYKKIKYLTIQNVKLTESIITKISSISSLLYLEIEKCEFNEKHINILKNHKRLNTLYLDSNNNYKIGKNTLSGFKNLKKLILDGVTVTQININEIGSLPKISNVKLNFSNVTETIDFKAIKENKRITTLELLHINGGVLNETFFQGFKYIKRFVFAWMDLTQKNIEDISNLTRLREITLFECKNYDKLDFEPLKKLKYLTVFKVIGREDEPNPLNEIPNIVYSMSRLKKLTITHQNIHTIPNELSNLKNLEYIDLCYNDLYELPSFLENNNKLNYVNFKANNNLKGKVLPNRSISRCFYDEDNEFLCKSPDTKLRCLRNYYFNDCTN